MGPERAPSSIVLIALLLVACSGADKSAPAPARESPAAHVHFGAPFSGVADVELAGLLKNPNVRPEHPIRVDGMVRQSCTRRGCWLELATAMADDAPGCRVLMKDHAFFVPTDSAGSRARVEGYVETKIVSAALVTHMEEEGGHFSNKNADGTATELRIIASGVELQRLQSAL
jgi:hypothetical protein